MKESNQTFMATPRTLVSGSNFPAAVMLPPVVAPDHWLRQHDFPSSHHLRTDDDSLIVVGRFTSNVQNLFVDADQHLAVLAAAPTALRPLCQLLDCQPAHHLFSAVNPQLIDMVPLDPRSPFSLSDSSNQLLNFMPNLTFRQMIGKNGLPGHSPVVHSSRIGLLLHTQVSKLECALSSPTRLDSVASAA